MPSNPFRCLYTTFCTGWVIEKPAKHQPPQDLFDRKKQTTTTTRASTSSPPPPRYSAATRTSAPLGFASYPHSSHSGNGHEHWDNNPREDPRRYVAVTGATAATEIVVDGGELRNARGDVIRMVQDDEGRVDVNDVPPYEKRASEDLCHVGGGGADVCVQHVAGACGRAHLQGQLRDWRNEVPREAWERNEAEARVCGSLAW